MSHEHIVEQLVPAESYSDIVSQDVLHVISRVRWHDLDQNHAAQRLTALGSFHINDPEHWHYEPAATIFHNWEVATRRAERFLIAEGDQDLWGLGETPGEAIKEHYSSVGLQCLWAETYDIPIISGEPPNYSDIGQLMLEFPPEEVLLHYGIIQIPLLYRMQAANKPSLDEFMEGQMFPSYQRQLGKLVLSLPDSHPLHDFDFTYNNFKILYRRHFKEEPTAEDAELNEFYLRITSAQFEPPDFATQPVARVALRRRDLRYSHLGAVQAALWSKRASSFTWRGIFHTMALDEYLDQFGHSMPPSLEIGDISSKTTSGYLLTPESKLIKTDYEWNPWDSSPVQRSERLLPAHFLNPHRKPNEAAKARAKAYFSQRAARPIGPNAYIAHLTQPFAEWKAGFSATCKELEVAADQLFPEFMASYGRLKGATHAHGWGERAAGLFDDPRVSRLFFDKNAHICDALLAACFRLRDNFCLAETKYDYAPFNRRVLQLFKCFVYSAQNIQQAVTAFNTASKHLSALPAWQLREAGLTPIEALQHALELLDYKLRESG